MEPVADLWKRRGSVERRLSSSGPLCPSTVDGQLCRQGGQTVQPRWPAPLTLLIGARTVGASSGSPAARSVTTASRRCERTVGNPWEQARSRWWTWRRSRPRGRFAGGRAIRLGTSCLRRSESGGCGSTTCRARSATPTARPSTAFFSGGSTQSSGTWALPPNSWSSPCKPWPLRSAGTFTPFGASRRLCAVNGQARHNNLCAMRVSVLFQEQGGQAVYRPGRPDVFTLWCPGRGDIGTGRCGAGAAARPDRGARRGRRLVPGRCSVSPDHTARVHVTGTTEPPFADRGQGREAPSYPCTDRQVRCSAPGRAGSGRCRHR